MDAGTFIAVYLPIFIVVFVLMPTSLRRMFMVRKLKKLKGEKIMTNEMIKSCIGKTCSISTGSFGVSYSKVEILDVVDNWIKIQSKGKTDLVNIDFVQNIKIYN